MSLNPAIGHLYHDFSISNDYTALDAKEKFRTRQINAREDKQLGKYNKSLERAQTICKRRREWETLLIRQQLKAIHSRTPSLERGLKQEEERRKRFSEEQAIGTGNLMSRNNTSIGTRNSVTSYRSGTTGTRSTMFSIDSSNPTHTRDDVFAADDEDIFDEYTFKRLPNQINTEDSNRFIKRTEHVTRALDKVYRRHRERTASNSHAWEILKQDNADILENARIYLKNTDTLKMLETILLLNNNDRSSTGEQNDTDSKAGTLLKDDTEPSAGSENDHTETDDVLTSGRTKNKDVSLDESKEEKKLPDVNTARFFNSDDDSDQIISSTIANPSEASASFSKEQSKWTEIFRMPELWRQYDKTQNHIKSKKGKKPAVVHTGRYKARINLKDYDNFVR